MVIYIWRCCYNNVSIFANKKVKFTLEQAMKTYRRNRSIALLFLAPRRYMRVGS